MRYRWAFFLALLSAASTARANPEPTAYDQRSVAMGLTGTSYLERPAALALNPANLEGIETFGTSVMFNMLFVNQTAPVRGPDNPSIDSGVGLGPLGSFFIAGRIAPRVVFGGGVYVETGYGSSFDNVEDVDGIPNQSGNPEDMDVTFFVGEVAFGPSIRLNEHWNIGIALRLPFSKQVASLYQNIGAVFGTTSYGRVKNDLGGVGFPSPRFGITYKPNDKWSIGAMYRAYSKINLKGTTETELPGFPLPKLDAEADWVLPHAFQAGVAFWPIKKLLIAAEFRMQFHGADKQGNDAQVVTTEGDFPFEIAVPFGWNNVLSGKVGVEYSVSHLIDVRGGFNLARSATSDQWAQYFTPPPGFNGFVSAGLGFNWERVALDISGAFAFGGDTVDQDYASQNSPATVPGTDPPEQINLCSSDQVVRTACAGDYQVRTYWIGAQFTYGR